MVAALRPRDGPRTCGARAVTRGGVVGQVHDTTASGRASAVQVAAGRRSEDLDELLVRAHPALHLRRVAAVALEGAVDAADRLAETGLVDHGAVRGHAARAGLGVP